MINLNVNSYYKKIVERKRRAMIEVTVTVEYKGENYQTNVIARKEVSDEAIKYLAEKQVLKQWSK